MAGLDEKPARTTRGERRREHDGGPGAGASPFVK
jgi:hypothetical protein